ncbi:hypothetical protein CHGG_00442 [Chaetomium globosum CBS 148.51]|uniref:Uncharacterized protein n=1 Tax=Chaetomium globosum (strain ATCC 6205 / CBS 148.51 / DSM 1962 / NBRC 6347 / NRRL 1970) TaxID=306901 RepID=Q2HH62_CHAGB|nr:uncharacterized protein CHGG_00442 [Chaetomium globosum CBS 148.51]EAQ92207.1 hypothetical protein CHGG_00442 [Chaetomium globosum CBS 148.51]
MAWGKQKLQTPPSTIRSASPRLTELLPPRFWKWPNTSLRQLLPLIITIVVLSVVAWVCYQIYLSFGKIKTQARKQMGENVSFTKDGMRVKVHGIGAESYLDKTQSWVVKAWELGSGSSPNENDEAARRKRNVLTKPKPEEGHH